MKWAYYGRHEANEELLHNFLPSPPETIAVDLETISKDDTWIVGIGIAIDLGNSF